MLKALLVSNRILIAGYIGFGNAGDEAIAKVVTDHLRESVPGAEITVVSGNPPQTAEAYGVRAIGWRDPLAIAEAVRTYRADLVLVGLAGSQQLEAAREAGLPSAGEAFADRRYLPGGALMPRSQPGAVMRTSGTATAIAATRTERAA